MAVMQNLYSSARAVSISPAFRVDPIPEHLLSVFRAPHEMKLQRIDISPTIYKVIIYCKILIIFHINIVSYAKTGVNKNTNMCSVFICFVLLCDLTSHGINFLWYALEQVHFLKPYYRNCLRGSYNRTTACCTSLLSGVPDGTSDYLLQEPLRNPINLPVKMIRKEMHQDIPVQEGEATWRNCLLL